MEVARKHVQVLKEVDEEGGKLQLQERGGGLCEGRRIALEVVLVELRLRTEGIEARNRILLHLE